VLEPEFTGREGRNKPRHDFILERVARVQRRHGDVLLFVVGVHWSVALNARGHFFHRGRISVHDTAVRLVHAHRAHFHLLVPGVVAEYEFAELLHAGIALHADAHRQISLARAVIFESRGGGVFLDDESLLRIVSDRRLLCRGSGLSRR
jgi:hypothetical protein